MYNATIYCLCLHNKILPEIKKVGYVPVGLGNDEFSEEWLKDNTLINISQKNKYYGEYTFYYWFWKNILPKIKNNHWIGFCSYRELWGNKKEMTKNSKFGARRDCDTVGVSYLLRTRKLERFLHWCGLQL